MPLDARSRRSIGAVALVAAGIVGLLVLEVRWTAPIRGSVRAYTELITAANRQDLEAARRLCTERYLRTHDLRPAAEGGLVGLPRNVHKNFQAWRHGADVWLCPTNRVGPVYQFTRENGSWRFDGLVGLLRPGGRVVPMNEAP